MDLTNQIPTAAAVYSIIKNQTKYHLDKKHENTKQWL